MELMTSIENADYNDQKQLIELLCDVENKIQPYSRNNGHNIDREKFDHVLQAINDLVIACKNFRTELSNEPKNNLMSRYCLFELNQALQVIILSQETLTRHWDKLNQEEICDIIVRIKSSIPGAARATEIYTGKIL